MAYWIYNNQVIKRVDIQSCNELYVKLDFTGVDATNYPIYFQSIMKLHIEGISLEENFKDRQQLNFDFYNVEQIYMANLFVPDTFKFHAENIKKAIIANSTFAHIPNKGFQVIHASLLDIQNTTFIRVSRQSIIIEKTNKVRIYLVLSTLLRNKLINIYA